MRMKFFIGIFLIFFGVIFTGTSKVNAQQWCGGCQVGRQYVDPETGQTYWVDGCNGCTGTSCGSGEYQAPDGSCHVVGRQWGVFVWGAGGRVV